MTKQVCIELDRQLPTWPCSVYTYIFLDFPLINAVICIPLGCPVCSVITTLILARGMDSVGLGS